MRPGYYIVVVNGRDELIEAWSEEIARRMALECFGGDVAATLRDATRAEALVILDRMLAEASAASSALVR